MGFKKIVFTGGACGGKSSIIEHFEDKIEFILTPEPAWIIFGLQQKLGIKLDSQDRQHLIFNLHILFEYWAEDLAKNNETILMDRSVIDNSVFTKPEQYQHLLEIYGLCFDDLLENYSLVIYCESIAHTKPNLFVELRPFVDIEKTKAIDVKLFRSYEGVKLLSCDEMTIEERLNKAIKGIQSVEQTKLSLHEMLSKEMIEKIIADCRNIMTNYGIDKDIQNSLLSNVLKNQNDYLDKISLL